MTSLLLIALIIARIKELNSGLSMKAVLMSLVLSYSDILTVMIQIGVYFYPI
jgi:hypothetical protein